MKKKENETTCNEALEFLRAENKAQKERIAELEQQVELLTEAIRLAQSKRFGASSEHSSDEDEQLIDFAVNWLVISRFDLASSFKRLHLKMRQGNM